MNLLGITWGMGARDVGMKAAFNDTQTKLDGINKSIDEQGKKASKSTSKLAKFFGAANTFNIGSIARDVRELTGDTGNLSNSLESMAVANAKAARPFVAAMNLTGKEARKMTGRISGMAIALNVGAESVAKVFTEFNRMTGPTKEAVKALGMSERDFVKFTEGTGVSMEDMNAVLTDLTGSWEMAPQSVATFLNSMTELGKKTGMGTAPLKGMKAQLQGLDDLFETLPPSMQRTGDEITKLMESSVRLAGAFAAQGATQEEAAQMGADTAKMFAEQAVAIQRGMEMGLTKGDLGESAPVLKYLTGLGMTFEEAVKVIDVGSRDAVSGMQMVQKAFATSGKTTAQQDAMLAELSATMGESVKGMGWLAQGGDAAAASLQKMADVTVTGKESLKKLAQDSFSSGRTLQEQMDLMKQAFETRFRAIARKDVVRFVGDMGKAYKMLGDKTKELADDTTWGPLVKRLSAVNQLGARGLFMNFGKSNKQLATFSAVVDVGAGALDSMARSIGPAVTLIAQLGSILGPVFGWLTKLIPVWGWIALAVTGVVVAVNALTKGGGDIGKWVKGVVGWFTGLFGKISKWLASVDWAGVGKTIGSFIWEALTFIPKAIWDWVTSDGDDASKSAGGELIKSLMSAIWEAIKGIHVALWNAGKEILNSLTDWWDSWTWEDVKQGFINLGENISTWIKEIENDPDVMEFSLDLTEGLEDTGWAIQDWFYELGNDISAGTAELAANMKAQGSGVAVGKGIVDGISSGIESATSISDSIRKSSEASLQASADAVANFDYSQVDQGYATHAATTIVRAKDLTLGLVNTLVGTITGATQETQKEADGSIITFFSNVLTTAGNSIVEFKNKLVLKMKEISGVIADTWMLITHPEELAKRQKQEAAADAKRRAQDMINRVNQIKQEGELRKKLHGKRQENLAQESKDLMAQYGIGEMTVDPESGKAKRKKAVQKEQKFIEKDWQAQVEKIKEGVNKKVAAQDAATKAQADFEAAQKEFEKMKKGGASLDALAAQAEKVDALGSAMRKAQGGAKAAETGLKGIQKGAKKAAEKAGITGDAMEGVQGAIETATAAEERRLKDQQAMATEGTRLAKAQADAVAAVADASQKAALAAGATDQQAWDAGRAAATSYAAGIKNKTPEVADAVKKVGDEWLKKRPTPPVPTVPKGPQAPSITGMGNVDALIESAKKKLQWFAENPQEIGYMIHDGLAKAWDWATSKIIDPLKGLWDRFTGGKGGVGGVADGVQKHIIKPFMDTITSIPGKIADFFSGAIDWFASIDVGAIAKSIADFFGRIWESVKSAAGGLGDFFGGIASWFGEMGKGIATGRPEDQKKPGAAPQAPANTKAAGLQVGEEFAAGLDESRPVVETAAQGVGQVAADNLLPGSPIEDGPLMGVGAGGEADPAYQAGMNLMQAFANGIDAGAALVTAAVTNMLTESVLNTIGAYEMEIQKAAAQTGLYEQVAMSLVSLAGAKGQITPTAQVGPDKKENVKDTMKAALSVPGLAGITMAIINESAKQLNVLSMIEANTKKVADTVTTTGQKAATGLTLAG